MKKVIMRNNKVEMMNTWFLINNQKDNSPDLYKNGKTNLRN